MSRVAHLLVSCWLISVGALVGCEENKITKDATPAVTGRQLRVLSYNIRHGAGMDGKIDLARQAEVIKKLQVDFVALQEVDDKTGRAGGVDQPAELAKLTGLTHYRFGKAMDYDGGGYGEAVLSKHPIIKTQNINLPATPGKEPRAALATWIDLGDEVVVFVGTHLDHTRDPVNRVAQAKAINEALRENNFHAMILVGDMNATPGSEPMQVLGELWTDASGAAAGPTFPSVEARKRIDYVMVRPTERWRTVSSTVVDEEVASDHRPLLLVLELIPPVKVDPVDSSRRGILWPAESGK